MSRPSVARLRNKGRAFVPLVLALLPRHLRPTSKAPLTRNRGHGQWLQLIARVVVVGTLAAAAGLLMFSTSRLQILTKAPTVAASPKAASPPAPTSKIRAPPPLGLVLVVNLARRRDRWRSISAHMSANALFSTTTIERIDALDGHRSLDFAKMVVDGQLRHRAFESILTSRQRRVWGQDLTPGALGCLLSHAKAWERAVQLNASVLILEDDVELVSPAFDQIFYLALQDLPDNFGLLYLGDMAKDSVTIRKTAYSPHLERLSRPLWGTYTYVISPLAARRLLLHMFPADVQVDSYIKQVAEMYQDIMPNFVAASDLVYTDNSETRDTDAQTVGRWDDHNPPMRYHAFSPGTLAFDPTFQPRPDVQHHSESDAVRHAVDIGILDQRQAHALAIDNDKLTDAWRWLLCLVTAMHAGGGLCFSGSFVVVRSIEHLLQDVQIGLFMANAERKLCGAERGTPILPHVVYVSPYLSLSNSRRIVARLHQVVDDAFTATSRSTRSRHTCDDDTFDRLIEALVSLENTGQQNGKAATIFPPHLFDPLLPLQRPCHCGRDFTEDRNRGGHRTSEAAACQSRCDRLVAPPYAAGVPIDDAGQVARTPPTLRLHLGIHISSPAPPNYKTGMKTDGMGRWALARNRRIGWNVHQVPRSSRQDQLAELRSFCAGLSSVAKYGGAYVDARFNPRRGDLLQGVLSGWSTNRSEQKNASIVMLWKESQHDAATAHMHTSNRQMSVRFFAAPRAINPVATRLARACARIADNIENGGHDDGQVQLERIASLQLQQALADDTWSIHFFAERDLFEI